MTQQEIDEATARYDELLRVLARHAAHLESIVQICNDVGMNKARNALRVNEVQDDLTALYDICRLTEAARLRLIKMHR